jgi:hypothetical protein
VALLNPLTLTPLVATVDARTDSFFIHDLIANGEAAAGVSVSPGTGVGSMRLVVDVSALGGQDARLVFRLLAGSDPAYLDASFAVSNVLVAAETDPEIDEISGNTSAAEGTPVISSTSTRTMATTTSLSR